ncbi:hypothetical protein MTO96_026648 [Rhipicephalus appendiculatus]
MAVRAVPATFAAAFAFLEAAYDGHGCRKREAEDAFDKADEQFRRHFRLTKETVWWLCDKLPGLAANCAPSFDGIANMAVRAVPATFAAAFAFLEAAYDGHGCRRREAEDAFDTPDEQFRRHFRLTKETVWWLCDKLRGSWPTVPRRSTE